MSNVIDGKFQGQKRRRAVPEKIANPVVIEKPKRATGGNNRPDQAWVAAVADELTIVTKADYPEGFLYDVMYQWSGTQEEINPDFFEEHRTKTSDRRCTGPSYIRDQRGGYIVDVDWVRLRRQCLATPIKGANVCHKHGGQTAHVKAAAQQRLAEAAEIVAMRLIGLTGTHDELNEIVEHKNRISAANSVLDRAGIKGTVEVEITTPGYKRVMDSMFEDDSADPDAE